MFSFDILRRRDETHGEVSEHDQQINSPVFYLYRRLLLAHCETSSFMLGAATEVLFAVAAFSSSFSGPPVLVRT
jgi:hypothetical protein